MEVLDAQFERAKMYARTGDKAAAYAAYDIIAEKAKISTGKKIDALMAKTRVALFHFDTPQASVLLMSILLYRNSPVAMFPSFSFSLIYRNPPSKQTEFVRVSVSSCQCLCILLLVCICAARRTCLYFVLIVENCRLPGVSPNLNTRERNKITFYHNI